MNDSNSHANIYNAPAVQKAFQILRAIANSKTDIGLSELARTLGFSKSTTYGLTQALLKIGALEMGPRKQKFFIGPEIIDLAFNSWNIRRVSEEAQAYLDSLRDRINESVFLGALTLSRAMIIATAEASKPLKISSPPGTSIPLLSGAVGKVFLSQLENGKALKYIEDHGLPSFTSKTIVDKDSYLKELELVRKQGYALDSEEYMRDVKAIAVGLGNHRGLPLALWVVGFSSSINDKMIPVLIKEVFETVEKLKSVLNNQ